MTKVRPWPTEIRVKTEERILEVDFQIPAKDRRVERKGQQRLSTSIATPVQSIASELDPSVDLSVLRLWKSTKLTSYSYKTHSWVTSALFRSQAKKQWSPELPFNSL